MAGAPSAAEGPLATSGGASLQVGAQPAAALEEQRKVVTVLFADLSGSTALAERLDPEEMRAILGGYFRDLAREITRFGGVVDKYIGDAIMAVFGAPTSHEDDAERAVGAALAMLGSLGRLNDDLWRRYGIRLALRIGVNTGEVVAGLLAGDVQSSYTVVGDTVNTAQRLESGAPTNGILVGATTHELARQAFRFEAVAHLTLKGKSEPVPAYRVLGRERRASVRGGTPFVDRTAPLALLRELFEEAAAGGGRVVHLYGEAGGGKSRLVSELLTSLPSDTLRLRARCNSYETDTPYALLAQLFRRTFHIQPGDDAAAAGAALAAALDALAVPMRDATRDVVLEVLGYESRSALDPERKRHLLVAFFRVMVGAKAASSPTVLTAESIQWMDPASAAVLGEIVGAAPTMACLVVTTSRSEVVPWAARRVELEPLAPDAAAELVDRVLDAPPPPETRALVVERAGGNPFFIEELTRGLGVRQWSTMPATVRDVLEVRLETIDAASRRVVQRAAILGRTFAVSLLALVVGDERLEPALARLEADGFIERQPLGAERTYAFRHALLHEVAYESQLIANRRSLHGSVGAAIEELQARNLEGFVDALAFHYCRSDRDDKAYEWSLRAGDRARMLFANEEALTRYRAALDVARERPADTAEALERIADVQFRLARYDDARAGYDAARELRHEDRIGRARLDRKTGLVLEMKGAYAEAESAFAAGLSSLGDLRVPEGARIVLQLGRLHWRRGDYAKARDSLATAADIARALGADDVLAEALKQMGNVAFLSANLNEALEHYERSRAVYERLEDLSGVADVRSNLGAVFERLRRYEEAFAEHTASLALRERIGNPWGIGTCHNNIGELRRASGDLARAIESHQRAFEIWESIGYASGAANALIGLGAAHVAAGDAARGRADLLQAEARLQALGSTLYFSELYRYLAEAELAAHDIAAAAAAAERSLSFARSAGARHQGAMTQRVLGQIALARDDQVTARQLLEASRDALRELDEAAELDRTEAVLAALSAE